MGLVRQLLSRLEPQQDKPQPGRTGRLAIPLRSDRSLLQLVAAVVVAVGRARRTLTVDPVEGPEDRVECRLVPHPLQGGCRADQPQLAVSVEAARIPRTVRGIRQIPAVRQVATRSLRQQAALATGPSQAVPVAVRVDQQRAQTRTQSDGQAEPRGRHYHRLVGVVEQPERQPVRTGEQARHPQAEPDRVAVVARVMRQALADQAVTVGSALVVAVVVVVSLVG